MDAEKALKEKDEMLKTAGRMLKQEHESRSLLEKKARAQKIAFKKVEMGIVDPFNSYEALEKEATAILEHDDLDVLEKALEIGVIGGHRSGELEKKANLSSNPADVFNHFVTTGELLTDREG